jgi:hypothetical protein
VRREEREEAGRNDREVFGEEGRGGEAEREDVTEQASVEKRAPPLAVDEPQADEAFVSCSLRSLNGVYPRIAQDRTRCVETNKAGEAPPCRRS